MCYRYLCMILAGGLAFVTNAPADIVWSGTQYQRAYHDLSALDLNQDGSPEFTFNRVYTNFLEEIWIEPTDGQIVIDNIFGFIVPFGTPLVAGTAIDANLNNPDIAWESEESELFFYDMTVYPLGAGGLFGDGYLGISFNIEGSTHYGWIEMSYERDGVPPPPWEAYLYIHGWAWETEADVPIIAGAIPEPSTGILTMIGTLSLLQLARSRRRRRRQSHKPMFGYSSPKAPEEPGKW